MKVCESFPFRETEKVIVYFGLYGSSLHFCEREDQLNVFYMKIFSLVCHVYSYFEKKQFKMLVMFLLNFAVGTKIILVYNLEILF